MNHHIAPRANSATGVFARKRSFNWQHGQPPLKNTRGRQCLPFLSAQPATCVLKRAIRYAARNASISPKQRKLLRTTNLKLGSRLNRRA